MLYYEDRRTTCGTLPCNEDKHLTHTLRATCGTLPCNENKLLTHVIIFGQARCGTFTLLPLSRHRIAQLFYGWNQNPSALGRKQALGLQVAEELGDAEARGQEFLGQILHTNMKFLAAGRMDAAGQDKLVEALGYVVGSTLPQTAGSILGVAAEEVEIIQAESLVVEEYIAHVFLLNFKVLGIFGYSEGTRVLRGQTEETFGLNDHRRIEVFAERIAVAVVRTLGAERALHDKYQGAARVALANKHLARLQPMEGYAHQFGNLPKIAATNTLEERQLEQSGIEVFAWYHLVCNLVLLVEEDDCAEFFNTNLTNLSNAIECVDLFHLELHEC